MLVAVHERMHFRFVHCTYESYNERIRLSQCVSLELYAKLNRGRKVF